MMNYILVSVLYFVVEILLNLAWFVMHFQPVDVGNKFGPFHHLWSAHIQIIYKRAGG